MRATIAIAAALAFGLAPLSACGKADSAKEEVEAESKGLADRARALGARARDEARELGARARGEADDAVRAVEPFVDDARSGVEAVIVKGRQLEDKAAAMKDTVTPALSDGVVFKPIYQRVDDAETMATLDASIANMPRAEVIDGVTVGYRAHSKRQYLVLWRKGNYLVGFVYTSLTDIALEEIMKRAPALVRMIENVI